jgi:N6-adenosine-specific RNA methylase IME4
MSQFAPLPTTPGGFGAILADPPRRFASNSESKPGRNARRHYDCLTPADIATLPLADVAAKDAHLFLWIPTPFLVIGAHLAVMRSWGFRPTAIGFVRVKLRRGFKEQLTLFFTEDDLFFGPGLTLRRNVEVCVLGRRGKPLRLAKDVFEIILAPVGRHSEKPVEAYRRIERYCAGPYLELFARGRRENWEAWGDEAPARASKRENDAPAVEAAANEDLALTVDGDAL